MDETSGDPLTAYRLVNVAGTENLARQAAAHGVRRLVFLSSVKVHGEETDVPYSEQNQPAPQDPYGVSKLEAENMLHLIAAETGLEVVIIRPPLVYGPGVKANFLRLLRMVARGVPLPLASITNARSLVYLGNLIDAIITCATHPQAAGQTFLVSDGEDVSTPKLIRQLASALDRPARLIPCPPALMRLAGKLMDGMEGNFGFWPALSEVEGIMNVGLTAKGGCCPRNTRKKSHDRRCTTHPQAAGQTFLVSDGEDVSTPKLIRQLASALDRTARLIPCPPALMRLAGKLTGKTMAVDRLLGSLLVDSSKIRRELGWRPTFTMEEGLRKTAAWFKKQ